MKMYISGKMSGLLPEEVKAKFSRSECLARRWADNNGYIGMLVSVVNPVYNGLPTTASWTRHIIRDIRLLAKCDAVFFQPDWKNSRGARIEHRAAKILKKRIIYQ